MHTRFEVWLEVINLVINVHSFSFLMKLRAERAELMMTLKPRGKTAAIHKAFV